MADELSDAAAAAVAEPHPPAEAAAGEAAAAASAAGAASAEAEAEEVEIELEGDFDAMHDDDMRGDGDDADSDSDGDDDWRELGPDDDDEFDVHADELFKDLDMSLISGLMDMDLDDQEDALEEMLTMLAVPPEGVEETEEWRAQRDHSLLSSMLEVEGVSLSWPMVTFLRGGQVLEQLLAFLSRPKGEGCVLRVLSDSERRAVASGADAVAAAAVAVAEDAASDSAAAPAGPAAPAAAADGEDGKEADGDGFEMPDFPRTTDGRLVMDRDFSPDQEDDMRKSYRVMQLLASSTPSEAQMTLMKEEMEVILHHLFATFSPDSDGNLFHSCAVLTELLRAYTLEVYDFLRGRSQTVLSNMFNWLHYSPVAELVPLLICTPRGRGVFYQVPDDARWSYLQEISNWRMLQSLAAHVSRPEFPGDHVRAAGDVFQEVVKSLSIDPSGSLPLMPLGHVPQLLDSMLGAASRQSGRHTAVHGEVACELLLNLLARSSMERVRPDVKMPPSLIGLVEVPELPNQLAGVRGAVRDRVHERLPWLCAQLIKQSTASSTGAVAHPGYRVLAPFGLYRLSLVKLVLMIVEQGGCFMLEQLEADVWRVLTIWFFEHRHNNIYHGFFLRLFKLALRTSLPAQKLVVKTAKFITRAVAHFLTAGSESSVRGFIIICLNTIRLQAASEPYDGFLNTYLRSHHAYQGFLPELLKRTREQVMPGIPAPHQAPNPFASAAAMLPSSWLDAVEEGGIDLGSDYARELGFEDVAPYEEDEAAAKKRKKKKKKKSRRRRRGKSSASSADSAAAAGEVAAEEGKEDSGESGGESGSESDSSDCVSEDGSEEDIGVDLAIELDDDEDEEDSGGIASDAVMIDAPAPDSEEEDGVLIAPSPDMEDAAAAADMVPPAELVADDMSVEEL